MRRAQTAVSFFDLNSEANAVVQTKPAPGAAHAAFYRAQCFTISMTAFKPRCDQFTPNSGQITYVRTEQIDSLTAGNFCIQMVFLSYLPYYDQFVGCNFSTGNTWHY